MIRVMRLLSGVGTMWIERQVPAIVPIVGIEVEAADETGDAVDDRELLMMAGADGVLAVEAELQPAMRGLLKLASLKQFPLVGIDHAEIPGEDVDPQAGMFDAQLVQERQKLHLAAVAFGIRAPQQPDIAVESPAGDQDIALRLPRGVVKSEIIVAAIDEQA